MRKLAAALAAALVLAGCADGGPKTSPDDIDVTVDTAQLRAQKVEAGIETCRPGPGGGSLPELTLPCLGGGPDVDLADLRGPMILNIWWSGCGPCTREMPALQAFYEKHGDVVDVLGIDVEKDPGFAIGFAESVGATYPQVADPGGFIFDQSEMRVAQAFPQTVVIDADGRLATIAAVEFTSLGQVEDFVGEALGIRL